jgi:hypothetical protein
MLSGKRLYLRFAIIVRLRNNTSQQNPRKDGPSYIVWLFHQQGHELVDRGGRQFLLVGGEFG